MCNSRMSLPIKTTLPENFLNEEVRCGYTIGAKHKRIWAVELDLLSEFQRICKTYQIKYFAFAGTMLGAVRHKGYIPWDDDLDVALTRTEFNRFCKVAQDELRFPYFLQTALTDRRYFVPYARLRNSLTTARIMGCDTSDYNNGIYMDIYVLEGCPDSRLGILFQNLVRLFAVKFLTLYYQDKPRKRSIKEYLFRIPRPFVRMIRYESLVSFHNKVLGLYTKSALRVGFRHEFSRSSERFWVTKKESEDLMEVDFEWMKVPIPTNSTEILKRIYGDWHAYPPVSERGKWHEGLVEYDPDLPYMSVLSRK